MTSQKPSLTASERQDLQDKFSAIIQDALQQNQQSKINRMISKMQRMGLDTRNVKEMVNNWESRNNNDGAASTETNTSTQRKRRRSTSATTDNNDTDADSSVPKDENYYLVEKILKISDYYEILQVKRSDSPSNTVLKRRYRKLAMKLHPDSNKHRKSTEAFQKVQKAYATLTDESKKRLYDQYGTDDRSEIAQQQQQRMFGGRGMRRGAHPFGGNGFVFTSGGGDDFSEEIFRQFFGGPMFGGAGMHGRRRRRRAAGNDFFQQFYEDDDEENTSHQRTSRRSAPGNSSPYFTFEKQGEFVVPRKTYNHRQFGQVRYFIKESFYSQYGSNYHVMRQLDDSAFSHYREYLRDRCRQERQKQSSLIHNAKKHARGSNDRRELMRKAQTMHLKSCKILQSKFGG